MRIVTSFYSPFIRLRVIHYPPISTKKKRTINILLCISIAQKIAFQMDQTAESVD